MIKEKNTVTKFKLYFDPDKELEYINKMNMEGWKLVYIKGGILYTFKKTQPGEYVTLLHSNKKENISQIQAFAAQCGYESIPHTLDGFGDKLYLIGRKEDVSDDFVTDINSQLDHYQILHKKFKILKVVYVILSAILFAETALLMYMNYDLNGELLGLSIFMDVVLISVLLMTIRVFFICHKYKKKIKSLKSDEMIFE